MWKEGGDHGSNVTWLVSRARKTALRPIGVHDEMKELRVRWYTSCLAPRHEHVVCEVVFVVFPLVVLAEEKLYATPHALDGIGVGPGVRMNEVDVEPIRTTIIPQHPASV
jgi:hypothetical protein